MLVLLDIDGTLLNSKHMVEANTIEVIADFNGLNQFILCSARKPSSTNLIARQLNLKEKIIICYNGALIMEGEEKIYEKPLPLEAVTHILQMAKKYNVIVNIYSDDLWFVNDLNNLVFSESRIVGESPVKIKDFLELKDLTVHKVLLLSTEKKLNLIKNELNSIDDITFCSSKSGYLEITSHQASKRMACEYLLRYLSIDVENSLAIGDGYNDLELLQYVGIGIAMDNAPDDVKNVVKHITYSNDRKGVAIALKKFL